MQDVYNCGAADKDVSTFRIDTEDCIASLESFLLGKGVHNTRVCSGWVASEFHHAAIYKVFAGHAFNHLVQRWAVVAGRL